MEMENKFKFSSGMTLRAFMRGAIMLFMENQDQIELLLFSLLADSG
jgi:hypothetical protein